MEKKDLETGMVVEIKDGDKLMVIGNVLVNCDGYMELKDYNDDLTDKDGEDWGFSIVKVYKSDKPYQLCENNWDEAPCIWEREKEVDWSKIPVDTKVLVNDSISAKWIKRYFAKYKNGRVYTWAGGGTSWSIDTKNNITVWSYAKLYEEGKE